MKPVIAILAFMACILAVYHLPTPDPSLQLEKLYETSLSQKILFDQPVEFVESPLDISIP